uniref:Uncharacterized protein n=1 Tax=Strongyloides stercoralis TaxID=6248 RepID=A0AAF5DLJ8_STRER
VPQMSDRLAKCVLKLKLAVFLKLNLAKFPNCSFDFQLVKAIQKRKFQSEFSKKFGSSQLDSLKLDGLLMFPRALSCSPMFSRPFLPLYRSLFFDPINEPLWRVNGETKKRRKKGSEGGRKKKERGKEKGEKGSTNKEKEKGNVKKKREKKAQKRRGKRKKHVKGGRKNPKGY